MKHPGLAPYHAAAAALKARFDRFEARQVRREFNTEADALSNQAITDYRSGANPSVWTLEDGGGGGGGGGSGGGGRKRRRL